jgi:hypothetical protein
MRQSVQRPKNKKKEKEASAASRASPTPSDRTGGTQGASKEAKAAVPDDASLASADSFGLSEGGSQLQLEGGSQLQLSVMSGSLEGSQVTKGAKDSDSDISILQKAPGSQPAKEVVALFKLATPTTLVFISLDGQLTDFRLDKRLDSYSELQREIARLTKKSRKMYAIQDEAALPISSDNWKGYNIIRVKEIAVRPRFQDLFPLANDWESTEYHEARHKRAMAATEGDDGNMSLLSQGSGDYGKL